MRKLASTFEDLAGYEDFWGMTLKAGDRTRYLSVVQGTDNFFNIFGVRPLLGRTFSQAKTSQGKTMYVVLSYEVWKQSFNGDSGVIGQTVNLDGDPYVVIGVMPAGFRFPVTKPNLLYIPVHVGSRFYRFVGHSLAHERGQTQARCFYSTGRGRPLTRPGRDRPGETGLRQGPHGDGGSHFNSYAWKERVAGDCRHGRCGVRLLLIACANVAGLLLARGVTREREMALRVAIGAARGRLIRQLLVENSVLGILGAAAGLLFALVLLTAMRAFLIHAFMRGADIHLNAEVVIVTLVTAVFSSIGAGLIPAWRETVESKRIAQIRNLDGNLTPAASSSCRIRDCTGFTLIVVACFLRNHATDFARRMLRADIGFNPSHVLQLEVNFPSGDFKDRNYVQDVMMPLETRVRSIPGVTAAGWKDQGPLLGYGAGTVLPIVGQPPDPPDHERSAESRGVTSGFFGALGHSYSSRTKL